MAKCRTLYSREHKFCLFLRYDSFILVYEAMSNLLDHKLNLLIRCIFSIPAGCVLPLISISCWWNVAKIQWYNCHMIITSHALKMVNYLSFIFFPPNFLIVQYWLLGVNMSRKKIHFRVRLFFFFAAVH